MRVIIAGGRQDAEYLVGLFKKEKHVVTAINHDRYWAHYITSHHNVDVYYGDPSKKFVQEESHVKEADLFIALCESDIDNYVACKIARIIFNVKRAVCIISNPQYVSIFQKLGIDGVISSTQLLASKVFAEASYKNISSVLKLEDDRLSITDVKINSDSMWCQKMLKDINFPVKASVCAVFRDPEIIIPNGFTEILVGDKVLVVSKSDDTDKIVEFFNRTK